MIIYRIVLGAALLGTASSVTMACAPPGMEREWSRSSKARVSSALSSASSRKSLGITRWHSTTLTNADGSRSGTFDGEDESGRVRFLVSVREDGKTSTLRIESFLPKRGEWVWDAEKRTVTRDTLPSRSQSYVDGLTSDLGTALTAKGISFRKKQAQPIDPRPGADDPIVEGGSYWLMYLGNKYGYIPDSRFDLFQDPERWNPDYYDEKGKRLDPTKEVPKNVPSAEESGAASPAPSETSADDPMPPPVGEDHAWPEEQEAELDEVPEVLDEPVAEDERGNEESDFGADDEAGATYEAFTRSAARLVSSNRCRQSASSKTTGIRACLRYE